MTPAQKTALKVDILAKTAVGQPFAGLLGASNFEQVVSDFYNALVSPTWWAYRTSMSRSDLVETTSLDVDGTTPRSFDWASAGGYIARSQGERDAFTAIFNSVDNCKPSMLNVRAAFADIFSGAGAGAVNNRTHFLNIARRQGIVLEKFFAIGGNGAAATPATLVVEEMLSPQLVSDIMQFS